MKKYINYFFSFIVLVLIISCTATIGYQNENIKQFPATNPSSIKIYAERHLEQEVIEIGYVASHNTQRPTGDFMKEEIRKKAADMGANAIVGFKFFGFGAEGIAVRFK